MEIKVFQNAAFGTIRTMQDEKGEPLFCAKDVAEALGYKLARKAVHDHVEKEDVLKRNTPTSSGEQVMLFVNESGLYVILRTIGRRNLNTSAQVTLLTFTDPSLRSG